MIELEGQLICEDEQSAEIVRAHVDEHVELTRAEPGCLHFEVTESEGLCWDVRERFADRAAFEAHQARTQSSDWGAATAGIPREYEVRELAS